jgi:hypothetical protein
VPSRYSDRRLIIIFWTIIAVFIGGVILVIIAMPFVEDAINRGLIEEYRKNLGPEFSTDPRALTRPATSQSSQSHESENGGQAHEPHEKAPRSD